MVSPVTNCGTLFSNEMVSVVGAHYFLKWIAISHVLRHIYVSCFIYTKREGKNSDMIVFFGSLRSQKRKQLESKGSEPVPVGKLLPLTGSPTPRAWHLSGSGTGQIHLTSEAILIPCVIFSRPSEAFLLLLSNNAF
jgi:hypothetical protein